MKVKTQLMLGNGLIITLLLIVSGVVYTQVNSLVSNSKMVTHTYRVLNNSAKLLASMVDQETGMRGYLASGEVSFLDPYIAGKEQFNKQLEELQGLVSDSPVQLKRLKEIKRLADSWEVSAASRQIQLRRKVNTTNLKNAKLIELIKSEEGKKKVKAVKDLWSKAHSWAAFPEQIRLVYDILLGYNSMEMGLRGFLSTGDYNYLDIYNKAHESLPAKYEKLSQLNCPYAVDLKNAGHEWIEGFCKKQIDLKKSILRGSNFSELNAFLKKQLGKKDMDSIRAVIADFRAHERSLLKERDEMATNTTDLVVKLNIGGAMLVFFISVLIVLWVLKSIMKQLGKEPQELSVIAKGVSDGRFDLDDNSAKGVYADLIGIAHNCRKIENEFNTAAGSIAKGDLLNGTVESENFKGGFKNLTINFNESVSNLKSFIDTLPLGFMTMGKNLNVLYINEYVRNLVGNNDVTSIDDSCSNVLNFEAEEVCKQAIESQDQAQNQITYADSLNNEKVFDVISIPIFDSENASVGAYSVLSDQTTIVEAQKLMISVADEASMIADKVASSSEELSAQVEQVSRGAEIQEQRVSETVIAMEEMNSTVLEVSQNATQVSESAEQAKVKAESGAEIVSQAIEVINQVNDTAVELQENMSKLGMQAEAIGGVMNVINDIADQTNLLALNAAIEAARAGEAGRGFAVVADEVRKLAERTMEATGEVGANISGIQNIAEINIKNMENAVENIQQATTLSDKSGEALGEIVSVSASTAIQITEIATASEEQSATSEQINKAITEVNKIVVETSQGMQQSNVAVQDLAQMAAKLNEVLETLKK